MPPLRQPEALRDQKGWALSLRRKGMPQGFYGPDQNRHGAQPCPAYALGFRLPRMAAHPRRASQPAAASPAGLPVQHGLVHAPSRHGSDAPWRLGAAVEVKAARSSRPTRPILERPGSRSGRLRRQGSRIYQGRAVWTVRQARLVALVERGGDVRTFHVAVADGPTVAQIVNENMWKEAHLKTDESRLYIPAGENFSSHETRKPFEMASTCRPNFIPIRSKAYFSVFKRGMQGDYQHCAEKNLHRYSPNSTSGITPATSRIVNVRCLPLRAVKASASRTGNLTKPNFKFQAARFLRWHRRQK